jgi:pimeloyl-ACP methyl ester carboxylesterase
MSLRAPVVIMGLRVVDKWLFYCTYDTGRMAATSPNDEFALLDEEASEHGIAFNPRLVVRRESIASEPVVSALRWGQSSPRYTFLHGVGLNAHTWDTTIMDLDVDALAVDLPGHGDSAWFADADYSPTPLAQALTATSIGDHQSVLVGHSLGGLAAIALVDVLPTTFSHLIVIDITPGLVLGENNVVREFLSGPQSFPSREAIVERALSFGFGPSRRAVERGVHHNTRQNSDGSFSFKHHIAHLAERRASTEGFQTLWKAAARLDIPVLLVRAERGFLNDELVKNFLDRVPRATTTTLPCGHNVQEEVPRLLARAIRAFAP